MAAAGGMGSHHDAASEITATLWLCLCLACLQGGPSNRPRAVRRKRYKWIAGPLTTVFCERNRQKEPVAAKINNKTGRRWPTESG
jgi:hypothetical protein